MSNDIINKIKHKLENKKLNIGIASFTSCAGCFIEILSLADSLKDLIEITEIKHFPLIKEDYNIEQNFDVIFIEGSISKEEQKKELFILRKNAKHLVALGDCACFGNLQVNINDNVEKHKKEVYADDSDKISCIGNYPINKYVKVDYFLYGCPMFKQDFQKLIYDIILKRIEQHNKKPICWRCKLNGNKCLLLKGIACLGPITLSGCNALCPNNGARCIGCRGTSRDTFNLEHYVELLKSLKYSEDEIICLLTKYAISDEWNEKTIKKYLL